MDALIFDVPVSAVLIAIGLAMFGYAGHMLLKVVDERATDMTMTLWGYLSLHPYITLVKLGAVIGIAVGLAEPEITKLGATGLVGIGYAADSALERLKGLGTH